MRFEPRNPEEEYFQACAEKGIVPEKICGGFAHVYARFFQPSGITINPEKAMQLAYMGK